MEPENSGQAKSNSRRFDTLMQQAALKGLTVRKGNLPQPSQRYTDIATFTIVSDLHGEKFWEDAPAWMAHVLLAGDGGMDLRNVVLHGVDRFFVRYSESHALHTQVARVADYVGVSTDTIVALIVLDAMWRDESPLGIPAPTLRGIRGGEA